MVFRLRPRMTGEEGVRRRTKFVVLLTIITLLIMGYHLFSYSRDNHVLIDKQARFGIQLKKYGSAYGKCERSLKTAKGDVMNFHQSNKKLQSKIAKQVEELAESEKSNGDTANKLTQAYQFFLDAKEIVVNDRTISEKKDVSPEASVTLKNEIKRLKSSDVKFGELTKSYAKQRKALHIVNATHKHLVSSNSALKIRVEDMYQANLMLQTQLHNKDKLLSQKNKTEILLKQTISKLHNEINQMPEKTQKKSKVTMPSKTPMSRAPLSQKGKQDPPIERIVKVERKSPKVNNLIPHATDGNSEKGIQEMDLDEGDDV